MVSVEHLVKVLYEDHSMKSIHNRKLRIGHLAVALNESRNRLRLNLVKDSPIDVSTEADGGWRGFTEYDLCHLSIVRKLIPFGVTLGEANKVVNNLVGDSLKDESRRHGDAASVISSVYSLRLAFWRRDGQLKATARSRGSSKPLPDPCTLLVDPAGVLMDAYVRLYLLTDYISSDPALRRRVVQNFISELAGIQGIPLKDLPFSQEVADLVRAEL